MTREEKQKAIDALKISAPVMAVTQEEFNDYIQTLNQIMDWLEQEPKTDVLDKIRAEIERQERWLLQAGYTAHNVDIAFDSIKSVLTESDNCN